MPAIPAGRISVLMSRIMNCIPCKKRRNHENIEAKSSRRRCGWKKNHSSALYLERQKTISFEKNPEFVQRINRLI